MISFMISLLSVAVAQCRPVKIGSQGLWGLWPTLADTHLQCYGFNPRRPPHLSAYKSICYNHILRKAAVMISF